MAVGSMPTTATTAPTSVIDLVRRRSQRCSQSISTGGTTRVDEMALTKEGGLLLAANNAEVTTYAVCGELG